MGVIQVQEPGLFTTVQDLGREGFGAMGVSASGAADAISLRLGNRMVGNDEGAAGLEMTLLGGMLVFPDGALLALTGSLLWRLTKYRMGVIHLSFCRRR